MQFLSWIKRKQEEERKQKEEQEKLTKERKQGEKERRAVEEQMGSRSHGEPGVDRPEPDQEVVLTGPVVIDGSVRGGVELRTRSPEENGA